MRILDFFKRFPDEESCKQEFIQFRLNAGVKYMRCISLKHNWKKKREQWECKECGFRTTIKSGTVMVNSKLSFQYWFITMHFFFVQKRVFPLRKYNENLDTTDINLFGKWLTKYGA
jgi:hypothetical protein